MVDSGVVISSTAPPTPSNVQKKHQQDNSKSSDEDEDDDDDGQSVSSDINIQSDQCVLSCGQQQNYSTSAQARLTFYTPPISNKYMSSSSRSRGTQRWMKLRTTVQLTGAVTSAVREKKPPLKREDSFLKRFSTRQTAEVSDDDDDGDGGRGDGAAQDARRRQRNQRRTVINPDENIYFWWLTVITCCVLYNCWTLIVRQAFPELQSREPGLWNAADALCDVLFLLDVCFQLRTGYLEQGLIVYNSRKLAKHYVHSRAFLLDVSSLFPLDLLRLYVDRPAPLLRFPRFLKVYRSYNYYYMVESRTLYPNLWRVVNLIHILLLLAHWFGCFYFLLSEAEGFVGEWVYPKPTGEFAPLTRKYLASLYWSTLTLTTIGDLPTPESNLQRNVERSVSTSATAVALVNSPEVATSPRRGWKSRVRLINSNRGYLFTIVSYLIGVFIFATIVGQVGNVITNRNANRLEFERLLDGAKLYMRHHKVPRDMQRRVQRWYDYTWSRGRMHAGGDINTALGILPDKLKTELALHVNLSTLKKVTIFQECQPEFLHDLVLKMKAYIFTPGDLICRKGEVAREMFIIADGILEVISETGKVLTTMKAGDFFGEIGILNLDGLNRRTADVRSVGYAELFSLSREDVLGAMKDYPEAQEILQTMGKKRLMEARKAAVIAKKELSAQESLGSEGGKDVIGPDSDSARQKAVLMVRRLRRDAKDLRNYLMKSSNKGSSSLFRSKDRSNREDVRIEMETLGRDATKMSVKRRQGWTAEEKPSSREKSESLDLSGQSTTVVQEPFLKYVGASKKDGVTDKPVPLLGSVVPTPAARIAPTFLQRVLALKNETQEENKTSLEPGEVASSKNPTSVSLVTETRESISTTNDGHTTKAEDVNNLSSVIPSDTSANLKRVNPQQADVTEPSTTTAVQAWTATVASLLPQYPNETVKRAAVILADDIPQSDAGTRTLFLPRKDEEHGGTKESHVVKSILKHFSRSESDVSELLSKAGNNGAALVSKRKLTKTVSFRDQLAQVNSLAGPDAHFGQEECVSDLLFGIKHVLQMRLDDIQSQFKLRLVALETAMHDKEDVIHQLESKISELETRRVQDSGEQSAATIWPQLGDEIQYHDGQYQESGGDFGTDLTHPGYVCHPRRSWPMLPSKQRLCHQRSAEELLHPDHLWRVEFPSPNSDESEENTVASSQEEEEESESEITDWEEDNDEEEEVIANPVKDEEKCIGPSIGKRAGNDWEIQMLAQEMIKNESSKLDLADVAEEEEEEDESDDEADDVVQHLLTKVEEHLDNVVVQSGRKDPVADSGSKGFGGRIFPRKLCRQQSWAGEVNRSTTVPKRRDSLPTAEDHVIQHFVHSTLRRLDQLEKVFTSQASKSAGGAPPVATRRNPLVHQCSLQDQTLTAKGCAVQSRRGILHRHASLGETSTPPALSLLNIPMNRRGSRSPPLTSSYGTPLVPVGGPSTMLSSSCIPSSPTSPFARTMSTIAEPTETSLLNLFLGERIEKDSEEDNEDEDTQVEDDRKRPLPSLAVHSPLTDDDTPSAVNPECQPLLSHRQ